MKSLTVLLAAVLTLSVTGIGCSQDKAPAKDTKPKANKTKTVKQEVQDTVTGMAGNAAFKAGQKAKKNVQDLNSKHNKQLDEALQD